MHYKPVNNDVRSKSEKPEVPVYLILMSCTVSLCIMRCPVNLTRMRCLGADLTRMRCSVNLSRMRPTVNPDKTEMDKREMHGRPVRN